MTTEALVAVTAVLSLSYVAAGGLVASRVSEHFGVQGWVVVAAVVVLWPVVVAGVEVLWLLGVNDWHLR